MKKKLNGFSLIVISAMCCLFFSISSCKKETDCTAIITVVDSLSLPVSGASVRLYSNTTPPSGQTKIEQTGNTDATGKVVLVFELEATLDIEATYGTQSGTGIITLKPGETSEKTVTIE